MTTQLGINNPNSKMKDYGKTWISLPEFPLPLASRIRNLEISIQADENIRAYNFMVGNLDGAKFQAAKIGLKRAELRQMKAGM